jgi:Na+/glutamate symporter
MVRLDTLETLMAASLVLLLGRQILARTPILRTYTIPDPVLGGLLVALLVFCVTQYLADRRALRYSAPSAADALFAATEIAIACATFGLILRGLVSGRSRVS